MLGASPASVNSALQRARGTMDSRVSPGRDRLSLPLSAPHAQLVTRFAEAFERDDIDAVVAVLTEDVVVSMPPEPEWHQGRAAVDRFLRRRHRRRGPRRWRFVPTAANAQPAWGFYLQDGEGWRRSGVFVVGVRADGIESITRFYGDGLLDRLGLPPRLEATAG